MKPARSASRSGTTLVDRLAPAGERGAMLLALSAGAATVFSFAPFHLWLLPLVTLAVLFMLWQDATPGRAMRTGFAFGAGMLGAGAPWLYIALHAYGGMAALLAAFGVMLFCLYLSLFMGAAGALAARWTRPRTAARMFACAAAWPMLEWARSWPIAEFPWLSIGYAAIPPEGATWLAAYAPVGGVWLVSLAYALCAAALASLAGRSEAADPRPRLLLLATVAAGVIVAGLALSRVAWTEETGRPLAMSLVQGNVAQDVKFAPDLREQTFALYADLARSSRGRVIVLPESALPAFADEIPDAVLRELTHIAAGRQGLLLTGLFTAEPPEAGGDRLRYYNSVVSLGAAAPEIYRKRHLVPFGESIPLEPIVGWFIRDVLSIPLANQSRGAADQPAFAIGDQRVAVDICFEDVFGRDIRAQAAGATILVNVTNDAWYGRSLAARQHNQIAAMRALEAGRPLLRATNTGITSVIGPDGATLARLPWFTRGVLEARVQGRRGLTPYVRYGDVIAVLAAAVILAIAFGASIGRSGGARTARRDDAR